MTNPVFQGFAENLTESTAEQLFGYEQVAKADCEYPIDILKNSYAGVS